MEQVATAALPMPLRWLGRPAQTRTDGKSLFLEATAHTDWFVDPSGARDPILTAAALVGEAPAGDYLLSACVRVPFSAAFDAGALVLHADDATWAKLCFECSPELEPTIVSVVTRDVSDDANAFTVAGDTAWLRIARIGDAFAFHASTDGSRWRFVRHFALPGDTEATVGFVAQSPTGEGCAVVFDEIRFESATLGDLRDGS